MEEENYGICNTEQWNKNADSWVWSFQVSGEECERCVSDAISAGYRSVDTAQSYGNEEGVGRAVEKCEVQHESWGPPIRPAGVLNDSKAYFASIAKLKKIAATANATVIYGHDIKKFETLKKAPEYYE